MIFVGNTDIGKLRTENQDDFDYGSFDDETSWAIVCDGMGGANGGHLASNMVVDIVSKKIKLCYKKAMQVHSFENIFLSSIVTANVCVYDRAYFDEELKGMGTTIVAAMVKNSAVCFAHVGDSRIYKISGNTITQLTKDHSLAQEMLDSGQITPEEFENYPRKNIITRAIGVSEKVDIDFGFTDLLPGEALILCSDGLSGLLSADDILNVYQNTEFSSLADRYIHLANEKGGYDNITVVIMKG